MPIFDVRDLPDERREALAWKIRNLSDFKLPHFHAWNYDPCRIHRGGWVEDYLDEEINETKQRTIYDKPYPGCRKCGIVFRQHQRVSIGWLYAKKKALLADTMGLGKSQPLDSLVLTPTGFVRMGDVRVGQAVVSPDGSTTIVTGIFPQGVRDVYEIEFVDGRKARADGEHLWTVSTYDDRWWKRATKKRTTLELLNDLKTKNGDSKWSVQTVQPVDLGSWSSSIHPYVIGSLLGDGGLTQSGIRFTTADADMVSELNKLLPHEVKLRHVAGYDYGITGGQHGGRANPVLDELRILGMMGHGAWTKQVPPALLISSVADRLALLQGLLDTDGSPAEAGFDFLSASIQLADNVVWLTRSLGGKAKKAVKFVDGKPFQRIYGRLPNDLAPFRLQRKLDKLVPSSKYPMTHLAIKSIVWVSSEETQCIRVDSELHEYVTDEFVRTHNTTSAGGLIAMLLETGELNHPDLGGKGGVIIVPRSPALSQWQDELQRMMPSLNIIMAEGTAKQRNMLYMEPWQVLLIGPEMFRNDYEKLMRIPRALLITDDIDQLRNPDTKASYALDWMGARTERYVIMTGTPLQKRLPEMHSILDGIGGLSIFGSKDNFIARYVNAEARTSIDYKSGLPKTEYVITGYKNTEEFKRKLAPMVLRRTATDVHDITMPRIVPNDVYLDLYPRQRAKYKELQQGVIRILKEEGEQVKHTTALTKIHYGAAICAGLAALGEEDAPGTSVKMDWIIDNVSGGGDLGDEKVVIFANLKNSVRALQYRFREAGVGFVTIWGEDNDKQHRREAQERFWDDPSCRVLIGTKSIEQSLNLQVSRHLINVDMILNQARMSQLAGRIKRDGSAYEHVFVHNLLTINTQEQKYKALLEQEAALADHVWDEDSELFRTLSASEMLHLIAG